MKQLFVFFVSNELQSIAEGAENASSEEAYLNTRHNDVYVQSIVGQTYDECWSIADLICDLKLVEQIYSERH